MFKESLSAIALLASSILAVTPACAADKMALLIGFSDYPGQQNERGKWSILPNAIRDVDLVKRSLEQIGFEVHVVPEPRSPDERGKDIFWQTVGDYAAAAATARISVVYYSGHGFEFAQRNYLVPIDSPAVTDDTQIGEDFIDLERFADLASNAEVNLFYIDACRDGSNIVRITGQPAMPVGNIELAADRSPAIIVHSTAKGKPAYDAAPPPNDNSPFALAFAEVAALPYYDVNRIAGALYDRVTDRTKRFSPPQQPYPYGAVGPGYYFTENAPPQVTQASVAPKSIEINREDLETLDAPLLVTRLMFRYSLSDLERLGAEGDANAAYALAYMYSAGLGVARAPSLARSWAKRPSLQATWYGKLRLADELNQNTATSDEKAEALDLYRQAAKSRVGKALGQYASVLMQPDGLVPNNWANYNKGLAMLRESADVGYPYAMYAVAITDKESANGKQTSRLRALAQVGNPAAREWLCDLAARRDDHAEALRICTLAAESGAPIAQARLAIAYHDGLGVPISADKAKHWTQLALDKSWNRDDLRQKLLSFGYSFVRRAG